MGGKKKSLANRLAKMSEEERQRYMQHKADQEEEIRRRKEQLINTFLKNKIKREDAFARLNVAKLNENWHQLLRKVKCSEMKEEVNFMKEHVDRTLEFKNRMIKKLLVELEEAEEQYNNNFQSHLTYINKTIDFSQQALSDIHEEFEEQVLLLIKESTNERKSCMQAANEQELHLKTLLHIFNDKSKTELRENYDYYFKLSDDVINQNKQEFTEMKNAKQKQITDLWIKIGKFLKDYVQKTDARRSHLAELNTLDTQNAQEIEHNEKQISIKNIQIEKLEKYYDKLVSERTAETQHLEKFISTLRAEFLKYKTTTHKLLQEDEKNLQYLSSTSNATIKYLQDQVDKGEKLMQLSLICRKYETEYEHPTRFLTFTQIDDELLKPLQDPYNGKDDDDASTPPTSPTGDIMQDTYSRVKKLENFWGFYNKVLIKLMAMKEQKAELEQENSQLKIQLQKEMEKQVDYELDKKLNRNARIAEKKLFIVCTSANSNQRKCVS